MKKKKMKLSTALIYLWVSVLSLVCVLPMALALIVSFTDEGALRRNGYSFFPEEWSVNAYKMIFNGSINILNSYGITILVTLVGTTLAVVMTACAAYALANKKVRYRNAFSLFFFVTMVFNAGMVPWYLICKAIGLYDNIFALIIPSLMFSPFNLFLVRNYMSGLPDSMRESALLDGASDITVFWRIYLPLSVPVIATVTLFYGLAYWNDWWNAIMLLDNKALYPLQYSMLNIKSQINMANEMAVISGGASVIAPTESLKMATAMITIGPIIILYPYLQKYFVKGLTVGAVKG